jgi:hypothetical protein
VLILVPVLAAHRHQRIQRIAQHKRATSHYYCHACDRGFMQETAYAQHYVLFISSNVIENLVISSIALQCALLYVAIAREVSTSSIRYSNISTPRNILIIANANISFKSGLIFCDHLLLITLYYAQFTLLSSLTSVLGVICNSLTYLI